MILLACLITLFSPITFITVQTSLFSCAFSETFKFPYQTEILYRNTLSTTAIQKKTHNPLSHPKHPEPSQEVESLLDPTTHRIHMIFPRQVTINMYTQVFVGINLSITYIMDH